MLSPAFNEIVRIVASVGSISPSHNISVLYPAVPASAIVYDPGITSTISVSLWPSVNVSPLTVNSKVSWLFVGSINFLTVIVGFFEFPNTQVPPLSVTVRSAIPDDIVPVHAVPPILSR